MNRRHYAITLALLVGAYFLGLYQITPAYLYALNARPTPLPVAGKAPQVKGRTLAPSYAPASSVVTTEAQPTPWPAPEGWQQ